MPCKWILDFHIAIALLFAHRPAILMINLIAAGRSYGSSISFQRADEITGDVICGSVVAAYTTGYTSFIASLEKL